MVQIKTNLRSENYKRLKLQEGASDEAYDVAVNELMTRFVQISNAQMSVFAANAPETIPEWFESNTPPFPTIPTEPPSATPQEKIRLQLIANDQGGALINMTPAEMAYEKGIKTYAKEVAAHGRVVECARYFQWRVYYAMNLQGEIFAASKL